MMGAIYILLLAAEIAFASYVGIFDDVSIHKWLQVSVLCIGAYSFYSWIKKRESTLPRAVWQGFAAAVYAWFFAYLPWYTLGGLRDAPDIDVTQLIFPYGAFYAAHIPMLYAQYSCALRRRRPASSKEQKGVSNPMPDGGDRARGT